MGFFKGVGNIVAGMGSTMLNNAEEAKQLAFEWSNESNEFLGRKANRGRMPERMAAMKVLNERYDNDRELVQFIVNENK